MLSSVIVGGGPGGLGPIIWAAQHGLLPAWLDRGVAVVDRQAHLGGTLGRFGIKSDSLGGSYLECLEAAGLPPELQPLRDEPLAHEMAQYRDSFPPLVLVDRYMQRIGIALAGMLAERSALHLCTEARAIHLRRDGSVEVEITGPDGRESVLAARSAVVALGGRQRWMHGELKPGLALANCRLRHVMPSDRALSTAGLKEARQILAEAGRRQILILGGSHSAYSVAGAFLELPGAERLAKGQIVILQRREPRIFYPDRQAALDDLYDVDPGDVCPRTQRVNRMGGLRGFGREMWRQIAERPRTTPEPRVVTMDMQHLSTGELGAMIAEAALVVPSFGYRSAMLPVFGAGGERMTLNAELGGVAVGEQSRLLLSDGASLPNLFGIGLGTGYKLPSSMGGEPNFDGQANSLWLYHNDIGAIIYRAIHELTHQPAAAVAA
ncbi:phosphoglycerate kinase [Rhodospirillales bacterium URHD0017]|nr:phosphoglycerate kinase [Rhodospirillales bacterium URHD0017]